MLGTAYLIWVRREDQRLCEERVIAKANRFSFGDRVAPDWDTVHGRPWTGVVGAPPQDVRDETDAWINEVALRDGLEIFYWVYFDAPIDLYEEGQFVKGAAVAEGTLRLLDDGAPPMSARDDDADAGPSIALH